MIAVNYKKLFIELDHQQISFEDLCDDVHLSKDNINRIKTDDIIPYNILLRICSYLQCSASTIVEFEYDVVDLYSNTSKEKLDFYENAYKTKDYQHSFSNELKGNLTPEKMFRIGYIFYIMPLISDEEYESSIYWISLAGKKGHMDALRFLVSEYTTGYPEYLRYTKGEHFQPNYGLAFQCAIKLLYLYGKTLQIDDYKDILISLLNVEKFYEASVFLNSVEDLMVECYSDFIKKVRICISDKTKYSIF